MIDTLEIPEEVQTELTQLLDHCRKENGERFVRFLKYRMQMQSILGMFVVMTEDDDMEFLGSQVSDLMASLLGFASVALLSEEGEAITADYMRKRVSEVEGWMHLIESKVNPTEHAVQ